VPKYAVSNNTNIGETGFQVRELNRVNVTKDGIHSEILHLQARGTMGVHGDSAT
jgi:hypothetical protein